WGGGGPCGFVPSLPPCCLSFPPQMKTWVCDSGQKLEIFIPFLGKYRPRSGRCCQTCTPKSWPLTGETSLSVSLPRYRGWLVRRVCGFLAVWGWKVPADTPRDLPARICCSPAASSPNPPRPPAGLLTCWFSCRLCNWALLKLLNCLFLNVQLHRGQLEMVLRAAETPDVPLVFLSTHKSPLDGLLLSFLLFSQGLGVPRVAVGGQACSSRLRALLSRLGGIFLPLGMGQTPSKQDDGLPRAVLAVVSPAWGAGRDETSPRAPKAPSEAPVCPRGAASGWGQGGSPPRHLLGDIPWDATTAAFSRPRARGGGLIPRRPTTASPSLADGVSCSAVTAVAITSVLLLHKHREDFAWLLEEILLGQHDVSFSGQLRTLVQHSLILLRAHLTFYHLSPISDVLVVPKASAEALSELGHHSAAILPVFASEAVGGEERGVGDRGHQGSVTPGRSVTPFSRQPPLFSPLSQPCQPLNYRSQDIVDKLLLCGVLEAEEVGAPPRTPLPYAGDGWLSSHCALWSWLGRGQGSGGGLSEPQGSPGFLLFLCRLLSPVLRTYARAVAFLDRPSWPQPGRTPPVASPTTPAPPCCPPPPLGDPPLPPQVLEEVQTPAGPLLHLAQPFHSSVSRGKLEAFIQQFTQP
uniref:Glycerol-3-phosphate acyltransferase 2, mitochondrial n=1 Tax=Strix occidentalis caurina TaxID=311401 RepID=A0A8D0KVW4_STROC